MFSKKNIRLDKFWSNEKIIYDYHTEIQGSASRSVIYQYCLKSLYNIFKALKRRANRLYACPLYFLYVYVFRSCHVITVCYYKPDQIGEF